MGTHGKRGSRAITAGILTLLVLIATLGLAACGGKETTTTTPAATTTTSPVTATTGSPPDTGAVMWRGDLERTGVYAGGGPSRLGGLVWKFKAGDAVESSPAVFDGVAYVGSDDTYLYAVDIQSGREKWKFKTGDAVSSCPAISDGVVYFGSQDTCLYAVDIQSGREKWKFRTDGGVHSSPAVSDGVVYFGSEDGMPPDLGASADVSVSSQRGDESEADEVHRVPDRRRPRPGRQG